jgi:hypothetical protein
MSEMTREHLMAVKNAAEGARKMATSFQENTEVTGILAREYRRLSEVAAMIEAKLESRDAG